MCPGRPRVWPVVVVLDDTERDRRFAETLPAWVSVAFEAPRAEILALGRELSEAVPRMPRGRAGGHRGSGRGSCSSG